NPDAQVPLLLAKIEKCTRRGLWRNGNPKRDENILSGAVLQYLVSNRLRGLGADFATTIRAESCRDMRPEQFQIIVDLSHGADSRTGALDGVGLLDGDRRGNAANVVHARFVHAVEELRVPGALRHAPCGTLGSFSAGAPKRAAEAPALPRNTSFIL